MAYFKVPIFLNPFIINSVKVYFMLSAVYHTNSFCAIGKIYVFLNM